MHASPAYAQCRSPSRRPLTPSLFLIGKDSRGNWVVRNQAGRYAAVFVERSKALRFAMLDDDRRPRAAIMVPSVLDFGVDGTQEPVGADLRRVTETKPESGAAGRQNYLAVMSSRTLSRWFTNTRSGTTKMIQLVR